MYFTLNNEIRIVQEARIVEKNKVMPVCPFCGNIGIEYNSCDLCESVCPFCPQCKAHAGNIDIYYMLWRV